MLIQISIDVIGFVIDLNCAGVRLVNLVFSEEAVDFTPVMEETALHSREKRHTQSGAGMGGICADLRS